LTSLLLLDPKVSICFQRVYDDVHLRRHPRQKVEAVLLSLRRRAKDADDVFARFSFAAKGRGTSLIAGALCAWTDTGVNRGNYTDAPLAPNFPKDSGIGCAWSAEGLPMGDEAAQFPIDLDPSGRSLTLYLREGVSAWVGEADKRDVLALGGDDRIFRLDRVEPAACANLDRAIADPHRD
jgi:hypothetical protein